MLRDDINNVVKDAMKAKDERKLDAAHGQFDHQERRYRCARAGQAAALRRRPARRPAEDDQAAPGVRRALRQGRPRRTGRPEREEIAIISAYLPKQMSDDEVKAAILAGWWSPRPRRRHEGHGQGDRRAPGEIRRADGFRQGQRPGEGGADGIARWSRPPPASGTFRRRCIYPGNGDLK